MNAVATGSPGPGPRAEQVARLRRIRRYAVPWWMIGRATECRLAGDWRGACEAAGMDVAFDLAGVAREHGAGIAAAVEDDVRHLVPDLVRWHAPRVGFSRTTLAPDHVLILNGYGLSGPDAPRLHIATQSWLIHGPQRLSLRFAPVSGREGTHICTDFAYTGFWRDIVCSWAGARHLWDARHTADLLERCGGDGGRPPFLERDGTPRAAGRLPATAPDPALDPAGHAEWVTLLHERGEVEAAFAAAGIELLAPGPESGKFRKYYTVGPHDQLARMPLALTRLEPEMRRLGGGRFQIPWTQHAAVLFEHDGGRRLRAAVLEYDGYGERDELGEADMLADALWRRLPDLDLLRDGRTPPERLHPLVHDALFPERAGRAVGPPEPEPPAPVRVRCRGEWHEVAFADGALRLQHSAVEQEREQALLALGGEVGGCFAVQRSWRSGTGRLPRALRAQRQEIFDRAHHGDTHGVLRLLDLGVDPHVRDQHGRTLLHVLYLLDHERLLPLLLAAGLDVDAEDRAQGSRSGRTALHKAIELDGSVALIRALLDAGARIDLLDDDETTVPRLIHLARRTDLEWLEEKVAEEHPELMEY